MSDEVEALLRFPADRAVGWLTIPSMSGEGEDGDVTVPAQGDVRVPPQSPIRLSMPARADGAELPGFVPGDLSGLAGLPPDGIRMLTVEDASAGSLAEIAHLTGLVGLSVTGSVTDDDVAALAALPELLVVQIHTDAELGTGLASLGGRPRLQMLDLKCKGVTADGLAGLAGLDSLQTLGLHAGDLGPDHLKALPSFPTLLILALSGVDDAGALAELVGRQPTLGDVHCPLPVEAEIEMRKACPKLSVNGSWLAPDAIDRLGDEVAPLEADQEASPDVRPIDLTTDTWDEAIASDTPVLVDFWAEWCVPCKSLAPAIDALASQLAGRVTVAKVDIDSHNGIHKRYDVMGIPALLVFRQGRLIGKLGERSVDGLLRELGRVLA
jgi:thioredoxin 1